MALVCLCHGVSDRRIRREIDHGATSIDVIIERCQAGACCQSCHPTLDELLAERCAEAGAPPSRRRRYLIA